MSNPIHELTHLIRENGLLFVFANVFAEQIGLPIPAIPTLIVAGALTMREDFTVTHLMLTGIAASLVADYIWYLLGVRRGNRILRTLCRISLSPDSCVRQTEAFFERWGASSLLFAKFVPGFSTVAPPLAGASGVSAVTFLLFDGLGSAIWAGAAIAGGRTFHRAVDRLLEMLERFGSWSVAIVALLLALFILYKWYERKRFYKQLRMARVAPSELLQMMDSTRQPIVADVRTESSRLRDGRMIPGAIAIDPNAVDAGIVDLPIDREIVLYCT